VFTKAWFNNLIHTIVVVASTTFVASMVSAGTGWLSITALHAAVIATGAAVLVAVQGALAAVTSPPTSSTPFLPQAISQRVKASVIRDAAVKLAEENNQMLGQQEHVQPPGVTQASTAQGSTFQPIWPQHFRR
jgi:hypothetical protein